MALRTIWPLRPLARDYAVVAAALHPAGGGWLGVWRSARDMARDRALVVLTAIDAQAPPVLCTRVRLNGDVQTEIAAVWLRTADPTVAGAVVERHFARVTAALSGWPAMVALSRAASWTLGIGLGALSLRDLVWSDRDAPWLVVRHWSFWAWVAPLGLGACMRIALRAWIRRQARLGAR